jgi:hypothetical protein
MRVLEGRFSEIDLASRDAKEKIRSAPILDEGSLDTLLKAAPNSNFESAFSKQEEEV